MAHLTICQCLFSVLECFEIPVARRIRTLRYKCIKYAVLLFWLCGMLFLTFVGDGIKALRLNNNFSEFIVISLHVEVISVYVFILVQNLWKDMPKLEENLRIEMTKIDGMFMRYLQFQRVKSVRESTLFLSVLTSMCIILCCKCIYVIYMARNNSIMHIIDYAITDIIVLLHLFKIKLYLIMLNVRIESLLGAIRKITFMQRRSPEMDPILNICFDYSKPVTLARLKASKAVYEEMIKTFEMVNEMFGFSLLLTVLYYFVDLIGNSYWLLYIVLHEPDSVTGSLYYAFSPPAVILFELAVIASKIGGNVICFLVPASKYDSTLDSIFQINKVHVEINQLKTQDRPICDLAKKFSLLIVHRPAVISAVGFFDINLPLIASVKWSFHHLLSVGSQSVYIFRWRQ